MIRPSSDGSRVVLSGVSNTFQQPMVDPDLGEMTAILLKTLVRLSHDFHAFSPILVIGKDRPMQSSARDGESYEKNTWTDYMTWYLASVCASMYELLFVPCRGRCGPMIVLL